MYERPYGGESPRSVERKDGSLELGISGLNVVAENARDNLERCPPGVG
jgi:hypothetical protein